MPVCNVLAWCDAKTIASAGRTYEGGASAAGAAEIYPVCGALAWCESETIASAAGGIMRVRPARQARPRCIQCVIC